MTPSQQARRAGLNGLAHLVRLTNVPERTLIHWHHSNQVKFTLAIDGALWRLKGDSNE